VPDTLTGEIAVDHSTDPLGGLLIAVCEAHPTTGYFPPVVLPPFSGWIVALQTHPGDSTPSEGYSILITDDDELDRLDGRGLYRGSGTVRTEFRLNTIHRVLPVEPLTLRVENNTVGGALLRIKLYYLAGPI